MLVTRLGGYDGTASPSREGSGPDRHPPSPRCAGGRGRLDSTRSSPTPNHPFIFKLGRGFFATEFRPEWCARSNDSNRDGRILRSQHLEAPAGLIAAPRAGSGLQKERLHAWYETLPPRLTGQDADDIELRCLLAEDDSPTDRPINVLMKKAQDFAWAQLS
jgi:hypothetical protein